MKYLKIECTPAQWATLRKLIEVEIVMPDGTKSTTWSELITAVHEIGHIVLTPAVIEDGEVVTPAVLSPLWAVDIIWASEPLSQFAQYVVYPKPCGVHIFAGWESAYESEYCVANPTAAYCQPPTPPVDEIPA
jgi:hypothetical protein